MITPADATTLPVQRKTAIPESDAKGLVPFVSNDQIDKYETDVLKGKSEKAALFTMSGIAQFVLSKWQIARDHKEIKLQKKLFDCMRQRRSEYSSEKLQTIESQGGIAVYMPITEKVSVAAESWIRDVIATPDDKPWTLRPTPIPELPPFIHEAIIAHTLNAFRTEIQSMGPLPEEEIYLHAQYLKQLIMRDVDKAAKKAAEKMELKIEDQLAEAHWEDALSEFITDIVMFPTAFLKGPVYSKKRELTYSMSEDGFTPVMADVMKLGIRRVSPLDIYPSPHATTVQDGFLIERMPISPRDLSLLQNQPGYRKQEIVQALEDYSRGWLNNWTTMDFERFELEDKQSVFGAGRTTDLDLLQFWGDIQGKELKDMGIKVKSELDFYPCEVIMLGRNVIRAVINPSPTGQRPYYQASYETIPGSLWGRGVCQRVDHVQKLANSCARSLAYNMAIASGPQVVITDIGRIPPGTQITGMHPWKVWQFVKKAHSLNDPPIIFFQPNSNIQQLMGALGEFVKMADEYAGVPPYTYGLDNTGGAGSTASGLSMLMGNASKGVRSVIMNIDKGVIKPLIRTLVTYNMLYDEDNTIKGDVEVVARGALSIMVKEQLAMRRREFMIDTANPIDMQIIGLRGRRNLLAERAKTLDMAVEDVLPPEQAVPETGVQGAGIVSQGGEQAVQ